jgi:hypothetical protein
MIKKNKWTEEDVSWNIKREEANKKEKNLSALSVQILNTNLKQNNTIA